jgi:succinate dehydrogenase/fumarate reductase flavoprotein subunit
MGSWFDHLLEAGGGALKWPYPIRYGEEDAAQADVLVLGAGPAGCMAAIAAARAGASVILVDKGHPKGAGGGSGCDHWLNMPHPGAKVSAEECVEWEFKSYGGYVNALSRYIAARECYDTFLEMEAMGCKVRDTDDEFVGAPFRDDDTKLLYTYDYENRFILRVWGTTFKPAMYQECRRLGITILGRTMITGILTEGGRPGARAAGAVGFNVRDGSWQVLAAKAVVNCMGLYDGNWTFSSELTGLPYFHPCCVADGPAMAWLAGGEFALMEKSCAVGPPGYMFPSYGTGNPKNTWFPCNMVDAEGKPIPWVDHAGRELEKFEDRTRPGPGQRFLAERAPGPEFQCPHMPLDLGDRIRKGEFKLPLYADLPSMPDIERRVIWEVMIGQEGRSRVPIHDTYSQGGFDPNQDLLQSYYLLGGEPYPGLWEGTTLPFMRGRGPFASAGGLVTDWDLMTRVPGLFAAGNALFAANYYSHAATTGRYAGRKAARFAMDHSGPNPDQGQVERVKRDVYAPLTARGGPDWKELRAGSARVMQNFCGEYKNDELLRLGLVWMDDLAANVVPSVGAVNPHQLMRVMESFNQITCDRMILETSRARQASSVHLGFNRLDFPDLDPPGWHALLTIRRENGGAVTSRVPVDFAGDLPSNYEAHNPDYRGYLKT